MKLTYDLNTCARVMGAQATGISSDTVTHVVYDTRKIQSGTGALFFAFVGPQRNGAQFVFDAYEKGVRWFVLSTETAIPELKDAIFLHVPDPLKALQRLAGYHRQQFTYPVVAITGSVGKTTFKEWADYCLSPVLKVVRSPKSYNSQLGVALSLLEMHADADVALIEAGISEPGEMERLEHMIAPTFGVFTAFGKAHRHHFPSAEAHLVEKLKLFRHCVRTFVSAAIPVKTNQLAHISGSQPLHIPDHPAWMTPGYEPMVGLLNELCKELEVPEDLLGRQLKTLPQLALRLETFDGINGNTIINDTYSLDTDALREALHYQQKLATGRHRTVVIGLSDAGNSNKTELETAIQDFKVEKTFVLLPGEAIPWDEIHDSVVLVKGSRDRAFEKEVSLGREIKHRTVIEINLSAIRHNVNYFRKKLDPSTRLLCMVKASSYGSGAERVATFLEQEGINYFGVAFADEGVALREAGITSPILVMNPDPEHAGVIIDHQLEPALFTFGELDAFATALLHRGLTNYPVHLKFDTGMHRLGFSAAEKEQVLAAVSAQPEFTVKSIYSHLADADNPDSDFTRKQLEVFEEITSFFDAHLQQPFLKHILNSEGAIHYPQAQYDMVRLGIALYGYPSDERIAAEFQPAVQWKSAISQVKEIAAGESVGYGCSFTTEYPTTIAIVPVGYADGFRRSLSNTGEVWIAGKSCRIVGKVCMDMIMVDVTGLEVGENDSVEIIGPHRGMIEFAAAMDTIPYEVMTGLSRRMHRIYVQD